MTIDDLVVSETTIKLQGLELKVQPLTIAQMLLVMRVANVFSKPEEHTKEQIIAAEIELNEIINATVPDLEGKRLKSSVIMELLNLLMETIMPQTNAELIEKGVKFNEDPKGQKDG